MSYIDLQAGMTTITGYSGDEVGAYLARPSGAGPFPGVVLIHHMPGWDEWYIEAARKFAHHGYAALCPNLYHRAGPGTPDDQAAKMRSEGGVADDQVIADVQGAINYLRSMASSNQKVGVIGSCSGGRQAYLVACMAKGVDAVVDLWGGGVVMAKDQLDTKRPVAPIDYTGDLSCPILGLFGEEDKAPTPEQVTQHEEELKRFGKNYEFHMYPNAGHGFFYYHRPMYRIEQALDGWHKVFGFFEQYLRA